MEIVFSLVSASTALISSLSFSGSVYAAASSRITIGAFFSMALAMEILCRSPPERCPAVPFSKKAAPSRRQQCWSSALRDFFVLRLLMHPVVFRRYRIYRGRALRKGKTLLFSAKKFGIVNFSCFLAALLDLFTNIKYNL